MQVVEQHNTASVVDISAVESPDPTPGVLRNWDEQPSDDASCAEHSVIKAQTPAEPQAQDHEVSEIQNSGFDLDVSSVSIAVTIEPAHHEQEVSTQTSGPDGETSAASSLPAGVRLPLRGAALPAVGFAEKNVDSAISWTNYVSATVAISVGTIFLARSSNVVRSVFS